MAWEVRGSQRFLVFAVLATLVVTAGCLGSEDEGLEEAEQERSGLAPPAAVEDATVVAVMDWGINPYHFDFLAAKMPQHDAAPGDGLPLDRGPHAWLPNFPQRSSFASYGDLSLTLTPGDPEADPSELHEKDTDAWEDLEASSEDEVHYRYVPGTKVIGLLTTDGDPYAQDSHGLGSASVSVGNVHGTCPDCLLVFVHNPSRAVEDWVREQDWIDVTTHSYEGSIVGGPVRDSIQDCETDTRQRAVERGQQIFWAAGNGLANTFTAPQTTLASCEKGPEWTVTVGAVHPESEASYTGHGKPVHVANVGQSYPSAGGSNVSGEGSFGGTSSATPTTAGLFAQALAELRSSVDGDERVQEAGVILRGPPSCGEANPECAMADGELTVHELRGALFAAAQHTGRYFHPSATADEPIPVEGTRETMLWTQGYGTFLGHLGDWQAQVSAIVEIVRGERAPDVDDDTRAWMRAYSWCSQQVWGAWEHGAWTSGEEVPGPSPDWPLRTWMGSPSCPTSTEALLTTENAATSAPTPPTPSDP